MAKHVQYLFSQKNKTSVTDLARIVTFEYVEPENLLLRENKFALTLLPKGLIFLVDISCVEFY